MASPLDRLPGFQVLEMREDQESVTVVGTLESSTTAKEGHLAYLVSLEGPTFLRCRVTRIDPKSMEADLRLLSPVHGPLLEVGSTLRVMDTYWGDRAALVADRTREWTRTEFVPRPNWDHEHCLICWQGISGFGGEDEAVAYRDSGDDWVCQRCYADYVQPKRFEFLENAGEDLKPRGVES